MKSGSWITGWVFIVLLLSVLIIGFVYRVDPFFHYHEPDIDRYYYRLDNQRAQNDGITRSFDYNALISGTSMTENFKTSDLDEIFGVKSVKIPYSGAGYKEINEGIERALKYNPELKTVVRGIDLDYLFTKKDWMRDDLGTYPEYLYDDNPFNDVKYLFNQDIIFNRAYKMVLDRNTPGFKPGMISFDDYSAWQQFFTMGRKEICKDKIKKADPMSEIHMNEEEQRDLRENIEQNITYLPMRYPDVEFYYFFTPYSMAWWSKYYNEGSIYKYIEAEKYALELILQYDNVKMYSYDTRIDITSDLNNYKDTTHYASWINTLILYWMRDGDGLITKDNYLKYISDELKLHLDYDYDSLNYQEDVDDDMAYGELVLEREKAKLRSDIVGTDE